MVALACAARTAPVNRVCMSECVHSPVCVQGPMCGCAREYMCAHVPVCVHVSVHTCSALCVCQVLCVHARPSMCAQQVCTRVRVRVPRPCAHVCVCACSRICAWATCMCPGVCARPCICVWPVCVCPCICAWATCACPCAGGARPFSLLTLFGAAQGAPPKSLSGQYVRAEVGGRLVPSGSAAEQSVCCACSW